MAKLRVDKIASVGVSTETTGSVFFDGTGDYLQIANNTDFQFGTGDFALSSGGMDSITKHNTDYGLLFFSFFNIKLDWNYRLYQQ